jgi:FO synthase
MDNVVAGQSHINLALEAMPWQALAKRAAHKNLTHAGPATVTYSRKVFIPLTRLCRDSCSYCTFAKSPRQVPKPYLALDEVLEIARAGASATCREALFTLGERPELRYQAARDWLTENGYQSTLDYVAIAARAVYEETGLWPHINAGSLTVVEVLQLRPVAFSMGMMLESLAPQLTHRGGAHFAAPDKSPELRRAALLAAGEAQIPFTTGLLIGIGESRADRLADLAFIADAHKQHGHVQEVIIQPFRAKSDTRMRNVADADDNELLWTIAAARDVLPETIIIQTPPNLISEVGYQDLIAAGVGDFGGISPVTPDHVNPEKPWPHVADLADQLTPYNLVERFTIYPRFLRQADKWLDPRLRSAAIAQQDAAGLPMEDDWRAGANKKLPALSHSIGKPDPSIVSMIDSCLAGEDLPAEAIAYLFSARGANFEHITRAADQMRAELVGNSVGYVINRNINYTNICLYKCGFCGFSKGKTAAHLRGKPYRISFEEIASRVEEAVAYGATEICMQGGIHPEFTGADYLEILTATKRVAPQIHIHAFSPLEVMHGAMTLGQSIEQFLICLRQAGLGSLPGTAAEILDDDIRKVICPDKVNTAEWLDIVATAHAVGLPTTSTIMFGHVDSYDHWATHLLALKKLQATTGGLTEFVPLPFVHMEAPIYLKGKARQGPSWRESVLMYAVARLVFAGLIPNIQASWVKLGTGGLRRALLSGANDAGGTLMNESITRSAGGEFGQSLDAGALAQLIETAGRRPYQRTTLYAAVPKNGPSRVCRCPDNSLTSQ